LAEIAPALGNAVRGRSLSCPGLSYIQILFINGDHLMIKELCVPASVTEMIQAIRLLLLAAFPDPTSFVAIGGNGASLGANTIEVDLVDGGPKFAVAVTPLDEHRRRPEVGPSMTHGRHINPLTGEPLEVENDDEDFDDQSVSFPANDLPAN
jgi:hypothetical protein